MTHELRERVARACAYAVEKQNSDLQAVKALGFESVDAFVDRAWPNYLPQADAAIAIIRAEVLEEAASMIEARWQHGVGDHYAAAIRNLKAKP